MGELADEQNEENAKRMQHPNQAHAQAGRIRPKPDAYFTEPYYGAGNEPGRSEPPIRRDFEDGEDDG